MLASINEMYADGFLRNSVLNIRMVNVSLPFASTMEIGFLLTTTHAFPVISSTGSLRNLTSRTHMASYFTFKKVINKGP